MSIDLKTLVGSLEDASRAALERAAQRCLQQTHFHVEIEHLLLELIDIEGGDFACVLPRVPLERDALIAEINQSLEQFKRGNTRTPAFSTNLVLLLQDALVLSTVVLQDRRVRSGTLLLALLESDAICAQLSASVPSILRVSRAALRMNMK
jgi:type VI secretion system protein VasG